VIGGDYRMNHLWLVKAPADLPASPKQLPKPEALTKGDQFSVSGLPWSPGGREIAFAASSGPFFYYTNSRIAVAPAEGGTPRTLTGAFDEDASLIDWGPDGIYFAAFQKTGAHIFRLNPSTGAIRRISGPDQFYLPDASFTTDHRTLAGVGAAPGHFAEVLITAAGEIRAAVPLGRGRPVETVSTFHPRGRPMEIHRRNPHRRHPHQACRLRSRSSALPPKAR